MFYEYALDPSILSKIENYNAFFESFLNNPSRLIADVPKKWSRKACQAINNLPHEQFRPKRKQFLKNKLDKLLKSNLSKNRSVEDWENSNDWLEYASNEHNKYPFSAIIGTEIVTDSSCRYKFSELFVKAPNCWDEPEQLHIQRNAKVMVDTVLPLLKLSKQLLLVDPYFSCYKSKWLRWKPLLKELVSRSGEFNFGKGINKIEIHTNSTYGNWQNEIDEKIKSWLPKNMIINCTQWPKEKMHDRFILTDVGGINFGKGLDEDDYEAAERVLAIVLNYVTYKTEKSKITGKSPQASVQG